VLTMSRLDGYPMTDIVMPGVDQSLKDWVARKYFRTVWRQILEFGVLHTDPHPGNYLVTYQPRLVILDFGSVRVFPQTIHDAYRDLIRATVSRDRDAMGGSLLRLGFLDPQDDPNPLVDILEILWEPLMIDRPCDRRKIDAIEKGMEAARIELEARSFKRPGHAVFLARALLGLDAYVLQLGTIANWHRELVACLEHAERCGPGHR